jgi:hypothetical protein
MEDRSFRRLRARLRPVGARRQIYQPLANRLADCCSKAEGFRKAFQQPLVSLKPSPITDLASLRSDQAIAPAFTKCLLRSNSPMVCIGGDGSLPLNYFHGGRTPATEGVGLRSLRQLILYSSAELQTGRAEVPSGKTAADVRAGGVRFHNLARYQTVSLHELRQSRVCGLACNVSVHRFT